MKGSFRDMAIINKFHICLTGVQERQQGENGTSTQFRDTTVENFSGLMTYTHPQKSIEFPG